MGVSESHPDICFHCGLPNQQTNISSLMVFGEARTFCCHGCRAVCTTIIQSGFEAFYQHRTNIFQSRQAPAQSTAQLHEMLALYDQPEIKSEFVIKRAGVEEACLLLEDIHCPACIWLNEHHLRKRKGVISVEIDAVSHRANICWDPAQIKLSQILLAINDIGYQAHPFDPAKNQQQLEHRRQKSTERLLFSGIFGMFIMQFSIATYFMGHSVTGLTPQYWELGGRYLGLLLSFALLAYPGQMFFISAWRAIRRRSINMDVPIALGLASAFLGSTVAVLSGQGEVYFDAIAMFVFFILLSRRYELKGQLYASRFLARLHKQKLTTAEVLQPDGKTLCTPINALSERDVVVVLPGATLPIDGRLASDWAEIDESLLTGESQLQRRQRGDALYAGSINGTQTIRIEAVKVGGLARIDHINRLILRATQGKSTLELRVNRIAGQFVLALLWVTLMTLAYWLWQGSSNWLANTIAVLIVTCPCALALAIPVAHSISSARLLALGILPLNMNALEKLANATVAVFDKTGTLTHSELTLVGHHYERPEQQAASIQLIMRLAAESEHPVARALIKALGDARADAREDVLVVVNHPGHGLTATVASEEIRLGAFDFVFPDLSVNEASRRKLTMWEHKGYQVIAFSGAADASVAYFAFSSQLRAGAKQMIGGLRKLGVNKIIIASGDHEANVSLLAGKLGVNQYASRLTPSEKLSLIHKLKASGQPLIMVGDGINDAPTLAAADASIALDCGADLAKINSDFVLLGNDVGKILTLRALAKQTRKIVRQNIIWAVGYNALMVPAAASGLLQPWQAALGMSLSSLLVVMNSLRLRGASADEKSKDAARWERAHEIECV